MRNKLRHIHIPYCIDSFIVIKVSCLYLLAVVKKNRHLDKFTHSPVYSWIFSWPFPLKESHISILFSLSSQTRGGSGLCWDGNSLEIPGACGALFLLCQHRKQWDLSPDTSQGCVTINKSVMGSLGWLLRLTSATSLLNGCKMAECVSEGYCYYNYFQVLGN